MRSEVDLIHRICDFCKQIDLKAGERVFIFLLASFKLLIVIYSLL